MHVKSNTCVASRAAQCGSVSGKSGVRAGTHPYWAARDGHKSYMNHLCFTSINVSGFKRAIKLFQPQFFAFLSGWVCH